MFTSDLLLQETHGQVSMLQGSADGNRHVLKRCNCGPQPRLLAQEAIHFVLAQLQPVQSRHMTKRFRSNQMRPIVAELRS